MDHVFSDNTGCWVILLFNGPTGSQTSICSLINIISLIIITNNNVFLTDNCLFFQIIIIIFLAYIIHTFSFNLVKVDRLLIFKSEEFHFMVQMKTCRSHNYVLKPCTRC